MNMQRIAVNAYILVAPLLASLMVSYTNAACPCQCMSKRQFLESLQLIEPLCDPVPSSIITDTPAKTITTIQRPYGAFAYGNDVFVAGFADATVYRFDSDGDMKASYSVPGMPTFMEIRNYKLYVTNHVDAIYVKSVCDDEPFEEFLSGLAYAPISIRFTPDGSHFLVGRHHQATVDIYFTENSTVAGTITTPLPTDERVIHFDSDGNMHISSYQKDILVFNSNYQFVRRITYDEAVYIDGWVFQCDESRVLADRSGKVLFIDKDENVQRVVSTGFASIGHVAITKDGTLFVTDFDAHRVFIYKNN